MEALIVIVLVAAVFGAVLRWGADSRTGDDWQPGSKFVVGARHSGAR